MACHSTKHGKPAGGLVLDDDRPLDKEGWVTWSGFQTLPKDVPRTYARLAQYSPPYQSRRSPLIWKLYGKRLDGFSNEDIDSPGLDYDDDQHIRNWGHHSHRSRMDVDYTGSIMPPPKAVAGTYQGPDGKPVKVQQLSDEDKLTLVRWIDLGSPIDRPDSNTADSDNSEDRLGWFLDEGRPTLTLAEPQPGVNAQPLSRLLIGMHDYYSGLDMKSFTVTADFAIDGISAGENLAAQFRPLSGGRWEFQLKSPLKQPLSGKLTVSVSDNQGNITRIDRTLSIVATRNAQ